MRTARLIIASLVPSVVVAAVVCFGIGAFDVLVRHNCDNKFGCWGGVQIGAVLAAFVAAVAGTALACFALAVQAMSTRSLTPRPLSLFAAVLGLAIATFLTSHIWGR
jgi:hypothetical protein